MADENAPEPSGRCSGPAFLPVGSIEEAREMKRREDAALAALLADARVSESEGRIGGPPIEKVGSIEEIRERRRLTDERLRAILATGSSPAPDHPS